MSYEKYLSNNQSSLFSAENDIDDDEFLRRRPVNSNLGYGITSDRTSNSISYSSGNSFRNSHDNFEEKKLQLLEKKREIDEQTLESTKRSLSLLRNSEDVGIATAEELLRQREQLEKTNKRLDDINQTLRFSQKHIQGIKSVFGSLKNYFSGKGDSSQVPPQYTENITPDVKAHTRPVENIASSSDSGFKSQVHPGLRIRGLAEDNDDDNNVPRQQSATADPQKAIDENLDEILGSLSGLKGLAYKLGDELESQNELIDNILPKVETSDITIQRQNKDIKNLLK